MPLRQHFTVIRSRPHQPTGCLLEVGSLSGRYFGGFADLSEELL